MAEPSAPAYRVRRSTRARRARLTVDELGDAVVVLPYRAPLSVAAMLVEQHGAWIERHQARIRSERTRLARRPALGLGRCLEIGGVTYRVSEVDGVDARPERGHVEEVPGQLVVRLGRDGSDTATLLDGWLRERARRVIGSRVAELAPRLGVRPVRIRIADQSSRWGSASQRGTLSFSWRLILAPPEVLDAVVVHELAHLRIRGHTRAFWALVEQHAPQASEARRWLRTHAREVRAALD